MKTLPVCIFTRNRTGCAVATVEALLSNLSCTGRQLRYIICDDRSEKGHVEAIVEKFTENDIVPSVHRTTPERHGLGASMNMGLEDAFSDSDLCLRLEDDWLLKFPLDLGHWCECMGPKKIGSLRLGMMFRDKNELEPYGDGLLRLKSYLGRVYTFNNQVALVSKELCTRLGPYPENANTQHVERHHAMKYNALTGKGRKPPYDCWPEGWNTLTHYGSKMAFDHIGVSTVAHKYKIPVKYKELNDPSLDRRLRAKFA